MQIVPSFLSRNAGIIFLRSFSTFDGEGYIVAENEKEVEEINLIRHITGWIVDIAVALALAWFCLHSFGTQVQIAGQSMSPLLESGDVVLMNRLIYDISSPRVGDVVVFEREDHKQNVKRVMGVPGDVVQIMDGWLYINGERYEDEDLGAAVLAGIAESPVELGEGEYFLLGDNRDCSEDSRFANVGNVKEEQILGKVWLCILPVTHLRLIRS
jgi:signal peptidase I